MNEYPQHSTTNVIGEYLLLGCGEVVIRRGILLTLKLKILVILVAMEGRVLGLTFGSTGPST